MRKLETMRQRVAGAKAAEFAAAAATRAAQRALIQEEVGSGLKRRKVEPEDGAAAGVRRDEKANILRRRVQGAQQRRR